MRDIDRNDVDITQLFKWNKPVEIVDNFTQTKITVYVRLVGDADMNRARTYGYRQAAVLRKSLRTENSDERIAFLAELEAFQNREILANAIVLLRMNDIYQEAVSMTQVPEPKEPRANASQEELEDYQTAVDNYPNVFSEAVNVNIGKVKDRQLAELQTENEERLHKLYEKEVIDRLCQEEMIRSYYDMCVYMGTFKDPEFTERVFSSLEEFLNMHTHTIKLLREAYQGLELGTDILKKLHEATE